METPGAVPMTEQAVWGVGSARKPRAPSKKPVLSGLAVASDPIGFWEGVGPDCAVAKRRTRKKKKNRGYCECDDLDSLSSGRMSLDLGDTWH